MEQHIKLNHKEAKRLRKLLKKNKGWGFGLSRSHSNGIGPVTIIHINGDDYNITDHSCW